MAYTEQVRKNGTQSDGARTARQRLINDIAAAFRNSQQGKRDIDKLSAAIRDHGTKSDQARGARSRLLQDLINSGVDSRTAKSLVDKLQTSISNMHGKTVTVGVHGSGSGGAKITVSSVGGGAFAGKLVAISNRAAGGLINTGTGPTADDVPAMLSKGEFVHQTKAVNKYGVPAMKAVNAGKAVIRYAAGGLVSPAPDVWGGRVENSYGADGKSALGAVAASAYTAVINSVKAAMQKAAADAALAFALPGGGGKISGSAAAAMAWARNQLASGIYGWGLSNWPPLRALWMGESGWNYRAYNASSGATGIPQSLPGSKMASAGADWRTNPVTQMRWGLGYIRSVYGSPTTAYSRWLARSPHWYSEGGLIPGYAQGRPGPRVRVRRHRRQAGADVAERLASRHGGGFGAAHGPVVVNEQIARMAAAMHRAQALAGAGGLSSGQHRFWANTAADEKKRLGVLRQGAGHRAGVALPAGTERARPRQADPRGGEPARAGRGRPRAGKPSWAGTGPPSRASARCSATATRT